MCEMGGRRWLISLILAFLASVPLHGNNQVWAAPSEDPASEGAFRSLINRERAAQGLGPLSEAGDLLAVARRHSGRMVSRDEVFHNPNLPSEVDGWQLLGENVGTGATVQQIHDALMDSKVHRDVILQARFTEVGVGVLRVGEALWMTQVFRQPEAEAAPSTTTTAPAVSTPTPPPDAGPPPPATTTTVGPSAAATGAATVVSTAPRARVAGRAVAGRSGQPTLTTPAATAVPSAVPASSDAQPALGVSAEAVPRSQSPLSLDGTSPGAPFAAGPLSLPAPTSIPGLGVVAAALLLAVVGSACLASRSGSSVRPG